MALQLAALGIAILVFAIGAIRNVNIGILMLVSAGAVGVWLAELPIKSVLGGFPIDLLILLAGVTYFFGVAQANGTVDRLISSAIRRVGDRDGLIPLVFFFLTTVLGSMGNPGTALVLVPIGMNLAKKQGIDRMLMALAMGTGISAGGFAPTSLFGIVTYGTAREANIALSPMLLFGVALAFNLILLAAAYLLFGQSQARRALVPRAVRVKVGQLVTTGGSDSATEYHGTGPAENDPGADESASRFDLEGRFSPLQIVTVVSMVVLISVVMITSAAGYSPNIGLIAFTLGAGLALISPDACKAGMAKIDWSTIILVGGIITYVGVLEDLGAVDLLGDFAASMSVPLIAAFVVCAIAGLISAFASTTGMLAALVPLAIPLVSSGGIPGWAMICAIGVCASIVDVSPFSTVGATLVATTPDESERPRMTRGLIRWGLSMVIIGPVAMVLGLIVPSMLF